MLYHRDISPALHLLSVFTTCFSSPVQLLPRFFLARFSLFSKMKWQVSRYFLLWLCCLSGCWPEWATLSQCCLLIYFIQTQSPRVVQDRNLGSSWLSPLVLSGMCLEVCAVISNLDFLWWHKLPEQTQVRPISPTANTDMSDKIDYIVSPVSWEIVEKVGQNESFF